MAQDKWNILVQAYNSLDSAPGLLASFLLQSKNEPSVWQITTVWESLEALEKMRNSVATPPAISVFQKAGSTSSVQIFNIIAEK